MASMPERRLLASFLVLVAVGCAEEAPTAPDRQPDFASTGNPIDRSAAATAYAVIGDVPYGSAAAAQFPTLIESINADAAVRRVVHVGDTKSGSTECSDAWLDFIKESFDDFRDPLIYTPGDNEWTDCHRDNNGNYNPLERLDRLRDIYFSHPGRTLGGRSKAVLWQDGYPENVLWMESRVVFAAIHVVGSNNNLEPATCFLPFPAECPDGTAPETDAMATARIAEATARDVANRAWLAEAFDLAEQGDAAGLVIFAHGDMWHPGDIAAGDVDFSGHQAFVELLSARASAFGKPVLLFAGDSHNFRVDQPLVGDTNYGAPDAPNVTQITVDRSIENDMVWLKLYVDPKVPAVFSWEEVVVPQ